MTYRPLDESTVVPYIKQRPSMAKVFSSFDRLSVSEVGDGNLNLVFIVQNEANPAESAILKQALPYLRVAGDSWPLTRERMRYETQALLKHNELAPGLAPAVYDFRERPALMGPISDVIPSTPIFEMYPMGFLTITNHLRSHGLNVRTVNLAFQMLNSETFDAEKTILGFDHADIVEKICKKWNIPKKITAAIKYHHNPWASRNNTLAYIVHASDQIAAWAEIGTEDLMLDITDELLERLGLETADIDRILPEVAEYADNIVEKETSFVT